MRFLFSLIVILSSFSAFAMDDPGGNDQRLHPLFSQDCADMWKGLAVKAFDTLRTQAPRILSFTHMVADFSSVFFLGATSYRYEFIAGFPFSLLLSEYLRYLEDERADAEDDWCACYPDLVTPRLRNAGS